MKKIMLSLFLASVIIYGEEIEKVLKNKKEENIIIEKNIQKKENEKIGDVELIRDLNKNIKLENDFYEHVNNNWKNRVEIPSTKSTWSSFVELSEKNQDFLKELIKEIKDKDKDNKELTDDEKKILILYNSYYELNKREKIGIKVIKKDYKKINKIKTIEDFKKYTIETTETEGGILYGWGIGSDLNDSKNNAIYLGSAGTGLPRDYFQKETKENEEIIKEYTKYIEKMLKHLNEENVEEKAKKVVNFEKEISKLLLTNEEAYDVKKYNNPRTIEEVKKMVKSVDIEEYLKAVGVNTDRVIITQLKYYENLDKILKEENIEVIKDYMKFHLISSNADILSEKLGEEKFEFYNKYLKGQKERDTLEKRALYFTNGIAGELIGKIYVEKNFSEEAKKNAKEMVEYIRKAFKNRVINLTWMSSETKEKALEKLEKFTVKIGYPDKWENFEDLKINENKILYDQLKEISRWKYKKDLNKIGKKVDKDEWFMNAHTVNAYYSPTKNEIVFPAGILQFPFYDYNKLGIGSNFGGIGSVIGHELTHGFDVSGANYDGEGNIKDWWTEEDRKKFEEITKKLEKEYSNYSVYEGINVNGKFTLTENIADLGGVNIAYDALKLYLKDHPWMDIKINNYTQEKLFFLNYGRIWRLKATQEYLNNQVKTDSHSPAYFRVNGVLKNVDEFHKIFETKNGDQMYKKSEDRIKIW